VTPMSSNNSLVKCILELKNMPKCDEAKLSLEKLTKVTHQIMTKRKWKISTLKEFYPSNKSLLGLNVNRGATVMIRLRDSNDKNIFLPWESILGTMIHELTHNSISAHSAEFYKLMDELWTEVEKGGSGSVWTVLGKHAQTSTYSFDGEYRKLGHNSASSKTSQQNLKQLISNAAIRRNSSTSNSSGGHRLGGGNDSDVKNIRILAGLAAERRFKDDIACQNNLYVENGSHQDNTSSSSSSSSSIWVCEICLERNNSMKECNFCGESKSKNLKTTFDQEVCHSCTSQSSKSSSSINMESYKVVDLTSSEDSSHISKVFDTKESHVNKKIKTSMQNLTIKSDIEEVEVACPLCTFVNLVEVKAIGMLNSCKMCDSFLI